MAGEFDLAVIGGGPAGAAAAIHARRAGLAVILLEGRGRPGIAPGETLHPGIEPVLDRLGVGEKVRAAGFHRHRGLWIAWDGARRFEAYGGDEAGPWRGFQADRRRLDEILLEAAASTGAEIRRGRSGQAEAPVLQGGRLTGIVAGGETVRARWTIDATGRRAWLARALALPTKLRSPRLFARFGWAAAAAADGEPEIRATRDGWRWHAPLGDGRSAWVEAVVDPPGAARGCGADLSWRMRDGAGPGYFLAGDAAATLDPSSSHGVLRALMTGIMAADLAGRRAAGTLGAGAAGRIYGEWLRAWFDAEVEALAGLYRRHPSARVAQAFGGPLPEAPAKI